jgi:putative ABC transport system ATP-binding protein
LRQDYVGFVFQNFQLLESLTAIENIILPLEVRGEENVQATGLFYLERVGLSNRARHYPKQLSGGEQQRVAIARAFACEAPIIFADEPTGNLDAENGKKIADLLFQLNQEKQTTLILVTHSMALAKRCSKQIKIQAGELVKL